MELNFSILYSFNIFSITLRMFLAVMMGMLIGIDRSKKESPAGAKTHSLVCLGATLIVLLSEYIAQNYGIGDITRMPAQVISGIGFLGAGMIMVQRNHIKGLTSAAGIWFSACIGLALGAGFYYGAIIGFLLEVFILKFYSQYQYKKARQNIYAIYIEFDAKMNAGRLIKKLRDQNCELISIDTDELSVFNSETQKHAILHIKSNGTLLKTVMDTILNIDGVDQVEDL